MKKFWSITLVAIMIMCAGCGCSSKEEPNADIAEPPTATYYPTPSLMDATEKNLRDVFGENYISEFDNEENVYTVIVKTENPITYRDAIYSNLGTAINNACYQTHMNLGCTVSMSLITPDGTVIYVSVDGVDMTQKYYNYIGG